MCFNEELCQVYNALRTVNDLVEGVSIADPATYYTGVVLPADMNLSF
jgi:hypothetical protein